jgi:hypothetical protein
MPNAYISREQVHAWSEAIGDQPAAHQSALTRLLKDQRRLTRFIEENAANLEPMTAGVSVYLTGVIVRMFDLAGGRLKAATWAQIREAEARVNAAIPALLPLDLTLPDRVRAVEGRAQAHILDEALMALFVREPEDEEANLPPLEVVKTFLLLWVATEVLDANWQPPKGFEGHTSYTYVHFEPTKRKPEAAAEGSATEG